MPLSKTYTLYGMAASLYTGKVRAYMRRNHIPFREVKVGSERFATMVKPEVGRWIIPVIETPDGGLVQDGSDILEYFDAAGYSRHPLNPEDGRLRVISHLFEFFGGEGLLRPAMHYRWSFDEENLSFLKTSFEDVFPDGLDKAAKAEAFAFSSGRMRKATSFFGVQPDNFGIVEESYEEFLSLFEAHLEAYPFLLGAHETHGDFGLFNPLMAHLGRDPKPRTLMQTIAPRVFRWTEIMNAPEDLVNTETEIPEGRLFDFDAIPDTLKALMGYVAEEYLPEVLAHIDFTNTWLSEHSDPNAALDTKKRVIGMASFAWRGTELTTSVMPYRVYLLQKIQDVYDDLPEAHRADVETLFTEVGLAPILDTRVNRRITRNNHLEVWADGD